MPQTTTAADIMRTKLVTLKPDMTIMEAADALLKNQISGAPVVGEGRKLVGIVSELDCINDLIHGAMTNSPPQLVSEVMTGDVETVAADTNLLTLAHLFTTKRYRRLPVVDEQGRLLGQLSRRDLMSKVYSLMTVQEKKRRGPLFLSAIYGTDEVPAKLVPGL